MLGPYRIVETDEEKDKILHSGPVDGTVFTRREWKRFCWMNLALLIVLVFGALWYLSKDMTPEQKSKAIDNAWELRIGR